MHAFENPGDREQIPKTFHVIIRRPFGPLVSHGLHLYVHQDTWKAALGWVESTFPGVDTRPTACRKNAVPSAFARVGNGDPVVIQDVDAFGITQRVGGRFVRTKAPTGHWRHSSESVADDLLKAALFLRDHSENLARSFRGLRLQYERGDTQAWTYDRLLEMKFFIERADVWRNNVFRQYNELHPQRVLDMPTRRIDAIEANREFLHS